MYIILSQRIDIESSYQDELYKVYHFPKRYLNNIHEGDVFIYYQGDRTKREHRYYYGTGKIGKISAGENNHYYAELLDCIKFDAVLPIWLPDGRFIESLGYDPDKRPAWQTSIRLLSGDAYEYIISHAGVKPEIVLNPSSFDHGPVDSQNRMVKYRPRDTAVSTAAKKRAHGFCQLCGMKAPFTDKNGEPYLECHHVIWLADGGADSVYNAVALCANCHRRMHVLNQEEDVAVLREKAKQTI